MLKKLKLKNKIKKFNHLVSNIDNNFINTLSTNELINLVDILVDIDKSVEKLVDEDIIFNKNSILFSSYKLIYEHNGCKGSLVDIVKNRIREENDIRRVLFCNYLNNNISLDNNYELLSNVSREFSNFFLDLINKPNIEFINDNNFWFDITYNNYIINMLSFFSKGAYIKYNYTDNIRELERKLLKKESQYIAESWSSSVAYLCELENLEEETIFGSDIKIEKSIYNKIKEYLFDENDENFMSLEETRYYSSRL